MQADIYKKINQVLSWKRVISFNLLLLVVLVIPLSVKLTQENTDNRSNAANNVIPSATPVPNYPTQPPTIERVTLFYGKPGDTIVLLGKHFGDYPWDRSRIFIGNQIVSKKNIIRWHDKVVEVEIPEGVTTGKVWIEINGQKSVWPGTLLIYNPSTSGKIGLEKIGQEANLWIESRNSQITKMNLELSFTGGPVKVRPLGEVKIVEQKNEVDDFGNKLKLKLEIPQTLTLRSSKVSLLKFEKNAGQLELLSAQPTDNRGKIVTVWSDPLSLRVSF